MNFPIKSDTSSFQQDKKRHLKIILVEVKQFQKQYITIKFWEADSAKYTFACHRRLVHQIYWKINLYSGICSVNIFQYILKMYEQISIIIFAIEFHDDVIYWLLCMLNNFYSNYRRWFHKHIYKPINHIKY